MISFVFFFSEPVKQFTKYVSKLNYNESPDYEKCRKDFLSGLKSLGKSNTGDLEFKTSASKNTSPSVKENVKPLKRSVKTPVKQDIVDLSETEDDFVVTVPKKKPAAAAAAAKPRKRIQTPPENSDDEEEEVVPKKSRGQPAKSKSSKAATSTASGSSIVVNNEVNGAKVSKNGKTYQLNFELDISFDANVVVNVKRKSKKTDDKKKSNEVPLKPHKPSILSTDEIPATEQSFAVGKARIFKKAQATSSRTSPRAHK